MCIQISVTIEIYCSQVQFQDIFSYMFISSASLRDLNERLSKQYSTPFDIPMVQFRPNVEIEGTAAYAEVY